MDNRLVHVHSPYLATGGGVSRLQVADGLRESHRGNDDPGYCIDAPDCIPAGSTYAASGVVSLLRAADRGDQS